MDEERLYRVMEDNFRLLELSNREQDQRFDQMSGQVVEVSEEFGDMSGRMDEMSRQMGEMSGQMHLMSKQMAETAGIARESAAAARANADSIANIRGALKELCFGNAEIRQDVAAVKDDVEGLKARVEALEERPPRVRRGLSG